MITCWYMWEDTGKTNIDVWWAGVYWRFKFVLRGQAAAGAGEACMCWMVRDKVSNLHLNATQSFGLYINLNCLKFLYTSWCIGIVCWCWDISVLNGYYFFNIISKVKELLPSTFILSTDRVFHFCHLQILTGLAPLPSFALTLPVPPVQVPQAESVKPSESKSSWEKDGIADWRTGCGRADSDWKGSPQARIAKNHLAVCWHLWWVLANNGTSTVSISIRSGEWNWEICDFW